jgi:hypothetical protein
LARVCSAFGPPLARWLDITDGATWPTFARGLDIAVDLGRMNRIVPATPVLCSGHSSQPLWDYYVAQEVLPTHRELHVKGDPSDVAKTATDIGTAPLQIYCDMELCTGGAVRAAAWVAAWGDGRHLCVGQVCGRENVLRRRHGLVALVASAGKRRFGRRRWVS